MKILVNEILMDISENIYAFKIRDNTKPDADIVIVNGFVIKEDIPLNENDKVTLIKRGEKLSKDELEHLLVSRHTPGVHEKVKNASVGIAGLGGLGSNIAISLARIGIGKMVLVDFDIVEPSNLNRQQYFIKHIGMNKTDALKDLIYQINPYVKIDTKNVYLNRDNIEECFKDADIIVEAFDDAKCKAELINFVLTELPKKYIIGASGVAGYFSNNAIQTKKITNKFYLIGDEISEAKIGCGLMAPRVSIAANHQANTVLRLILGEEDV